MASTDCVIPISGLSADGTATLCGVMTSPSEILLTPVLAQNENGLFAVTAAPSSSFLSHLKPADGLHHQQDKTVKFVQFVLNGSASSPPAVTPKGKIRVIPEAAIRRTPTPPPVSNSNPSAIDESCTICGQHYVDRSAFNAHIKHHLKEKLHIRRNKRKLAEEEECSERKESGDKVLKTAETVMSKSSDVIMAELAACQPVPPEAITDMSTPPPNPLIFPPTPASSICSAPSPAKPSSLPHCTSDEGGVMNKMEINYDLNNILDEIEQNLDPHTFRRTLETPPDSDSEQGIKEERPKQSAEEEDKVDLDKLVNEAISSSSLHRGPPSSCTAVIQSPSSIAKVGALPPKALAVLNQLPSKLFGASDSTGNRFINVVKIERSGGSEDLSNTIINIQCQNSRNNKIIESYRAVDTGKELKLIPNTNNTNPTPPSITNEVIPPSTPSVKNCSSECSVCGKTITTKNMARHMEKHIGKKKFTCNICFASFFQKTHLKNHIVLHKTGGLDSSTPDPHPNSFPCPICNKSFVQKGHLNRHLKSSHGQKEDSVGKDLECKICHKKCKNKVCLNRHRTKHMVCSHCSNARGENVIFHSKLLLQEHLLTFHPESAVLSVENYNSTSSSSSSEDENPVISAFLDYSSPSIKDEKLPSDFNLFTDGDSSTSSGGVAGSSSNLEPEEEPQEASGASIADISNSDYFDFNTQEEFKDFYLTDLF